MNKCRTIETANQVEYEGFVNACLNDGYILSSSSCGMHGSEREGFGELWFAVLSLPPADKEEVCELDMKVCSDCNDMTCDGKKIKEVAKDEMQRM